MATEAPPLGASWRQQKADQSFYLRNKRARVFSDQLPSYPKLLQMVTAAMKLKDDYSLEGKL